MKIQPVIGVLDSNTFIISHDKTTLVIDAGAPIDSVIKALAGKTPNAILLTHEHFDHVLNISDYIERWPNCPVYCHAATMKELKTNELNGMLGIYFDLQVTKPKTFDRFHGIGKDEVFTIDGLSVHAIVAPGHSAGSVCYLMEDAFFTGDVLFSKVIGRTDIMPNGERLMQESLKKLLALIDEDALRFDICFHGHSVSSNFEQVQKNIANHIFK